MSLTRRTLLGSAAPAGFCVPLHAPGHLAACRHVEAAVLHPASETP